MADPMRNYLNLVSGGYTTTRYDREAAQAARKKAASGLKGSYASPAAGRPHRNTCGWDT